MRLPRTKIAPEIAIVFVCLVLARIGLAIYGPEWSERRDLLNAAELLRVERLKAAKDPGEGLQVVAFGSSRMNSAFVSAVWAKHSGLQRDQVANLAVRNGTLWEPNFLIQRSGGLPASVRLVLVELPLWGFNAGRLDMMVGQRGGVAEHLRPWATLADRRSIDDPWIRARYLADVLWPSYLRRPLEAWGTVLFNPYRPRPVPPPEPLSRRDVWGRRRDKPASRGLSKNRPFSGPQTARRHFFDPQLSHFELRNLDVLLEQLARSRARIVFVQLPIQIMYLHTVRIDPEKSALYDEIKQVTADKIRRRAELLSLDMAMLAGLDESIFIDYGHYNEQGARRFTSALYQRLTR